MTPSRSSFFFSRRNAFSMVSPLRTLTSVTDCHAPFRFGIGRADKAAVLKFPDNVPDFQAKSQRESILFYYIYDQYIILCLL